MDKAEHLIRRAYDQRDTDSLDYMWYLWCGADSPVSGRIVKTFERSYIIDESTWKEPQNAYYRLNRDKDECIKILHEFGIDSPQGHIINGHTPVKVKKGESPIRAEGKEICIDGGFCKAYQALRALPVTRSSSTPMVSASNPTIPLKTSIRPS